MSKRLVVTIIMLFIIFGGLLSFNLFREYMIKKALSNRPTQAVTISAIKAKTETWNPFLSAVGNFVAINGVDISSQASGNVTKIFFHSGQYVKKNAPLINIDDSVEQTNLKNNIADLALKEIDYKRQVNLLKTNATSNSDADTAKANFKQAQAAVENIQAQINQKHIKAPFSGRLGIRLVNLGQYITPGDTLIVTLQSLDPLFLQFYLPEQRLKKLYINQPIRFQLEAYPDLAFEGKITAINAKIETTTHNILVQATIANCPAESLSKKNTLVKKYKDKLTQQNIIQCNSKNNKAANIRRFLFLPGMFANIKVILPQQQHVVVLPRTAISYSLYGDAVYIIKQKGKDNNGKALLKAYQQYVITGDARQNKVVIKKGIKPGDNVVTSGQLKLQNGTPVNIDNSVTLKTFTNPDDLGQ